MVSGAGSSVDVTGYSASNVSGGCVTTYSDEKAGVRVTYTAADGATGTRDYTDKSRYGERYEYGVKTWRWKITGSDLYMSLPHASTWTSI